MSIATIEIAGFHDSKIPYDKVTRYRDLALLYLKRITQNRITGHEDDEDIIICIRTVAEALYDNLERGNILSENNDGYSVTFRDSDTYSVAYKTARELLPPEMLYRGMQIAGDKLC